MVTTPYEYGIWRSVRNLWPLFRSRIRFQVGNGMKVSFWEDRWIAQRTLKQSFPDLNTLSYQQNATVADMWTGQGWNLQLRRNLNDWEMGNIVAFHDTMAQFSNLTREEDKVVWKIGSKRVFSVKSAYKDLNHSNSMTGRSSSHGR